MIGRNYRSKFPRCFIPDSSGVVSYCFWIVHGLLLLCLLLPKNSGAYYVGPEVGTAQGETKAVRLTRGNIFGFNTNATTLQEAAYVPYVHDVGNNVVTFLRSIIPGLQPKVDFFAEQIQDAIDIVNNKLMQTLENGNNGIVATENFFTGLMKAVVLGKGPSDEEERRKRLAIALIKSGMVRINRTSDVDEETETATESFVSTTTSTTRATTKRPDVVTTSSRGDAIVGKIVIKLHTSTTAATTTESTTENEGDVSEMKAEISPEDTTQSSTKPVQKVRRDNDFNKMKVFNIVKNMM